MDSPVAVSGAATATQLYQYTCTGDHHTQQSHVEQNNSYANMHAVQH